MKLLVPTTCPERGPLPPGIERVDYDPRQPIPAEHRDAEALVAWGNPSERLAQAARDLARLRWVQSLSAGMGGVLQAGFDPDVVLTSGRGLHDGPVAEHALALVLAAVRRLHEMRDAQAQRRWLHALGGLQPPDDGHVRTLQDAHVTIWGFGSIATRLAPLLHGLGARVAGVATTPGLRAGVDVHDREALPRLLPRTDVLLLLLPSTSATRGAVDAEILSSLPARAWLVNAGRGDVLREEDLVPALRQGRLAGAALDVFATEPLPSTSELWALPNVIVSPHAAGGRPVGAWGLIRENAERLSNGLPLRNVVDRERGY